MHLRAVVIGALQCTIQIKQASRENNRVIAALHHGASADVLS
jgi:hypothetical protein